MRRLFYSLMKLFVISCALALILFSTFQARSESLSDQAAVEIYLPLVMKNYSNTEGDGHVTGVVYDTRTGEPIEGILVCLEGTTTCAPETGIDGKYLLENIPDGTRKLSARDFQNRYQLAEDFVTVYSGLTVNLDFFLYPVLEENEFRVVLTWDTTSSWPCDPYVCPNDMNIHMWWTEGLGDYERFDIDHRGNCQDLEIYPNVCYETDTQYGSGPDTIAFKFRPVGSTGIYYFAVLNYYADWLNVPTFFERTPKARLQMFNSEQSTPVYDFVVDPAATIGEGDLWYVFQLLYGALEPQNCLSQFDQIGDEPPADCFPGLRVFK